MTDKKTNIPGPFLHPKKYYADMKKHKKLYSFILPVAFILGLVYALGQIDYYTCTVKISPELSKRPQYDGIGFNMINPDYTTLYPDLYPKLMNGVDFQTSLLSIKVKRQSDGKEFTYYDYLMNEQERPWWVKLKRRLLGKDDTRIEETKVDPYHLTAAQSDVLLAMSGNISCIVTPKTFIITIKVFDQDPMVAAIMADSVKVRLQQYLTDYHTKKSLGEVAYNEKIFNQSKLRYNEASSRLTEFQDANNGVILQETLSKQAVLENEVKILQATYEQAFYKLAEARATAQDDKPSFTTIQSAIIPLEPSKPERVSMCFKWMFFVFALLTSWVFYKEDDWSDILGFKNIK